MGRLFLSMLALNIKTALAMRGAFFLRLGYTIFNHVLMIATWLFLFRAVPVVHGWTIWDTLLTYGIAWFAWGFTSFFAYGFRTLARTIEFGELDHFLLQPRPILLMVAANNSEVFGIQDMFLALVLTICVAVKLHVLWYLVPFGLACAAATFTSFALLIGSLSFWMNDMHDWLMEMQFLLFIFATRPSSAFGGWVKFLMFSFLPIGFISFLPVEIMRLHDPRLVLAQLAGSGAIVAAALAVFRLGLRHYESGNRFGVRT